MRKIISYKERQTSISISLEEEKNGEIKEFDTVEQLMEDLLH